MPSRPGLHRWCTAMIRATMRTVRGLVPQATRSRASLRTSSAPPPRCGAASRRWSPGLMFREVRRASRGRSGCSSACSGSRPCWSPLAPLSPLRHWLGRSAGTSDKRYAARRSIGVAIAGGRKHSTEENFQVEPQRPIVDVVQIVLDALAHRFFAVDLAAIAVDLRPAGDAGLDVVAARVERDAAFIFAVVR